MIQANNIPACLCERPQWVAWKYIERDGKQTKAPVNPQTGGFADSTDSSTWGTFQQAVDACQKDPKLAGVGFVFTPDDPYCGVDLDDCIDVESGNLKDWAADIVEQLDSYTEISPSGTGVKVFVKANKPGRRCRKAYHDGEFEIVFSNSVIEHVGSDDRQRAFASEVRRVGRKFWVQTPSKWFPIEAHCGMPFWWFYPEYLRRAFLRRWRKKLPAWTEMIENTRVLTRRQLIDLFPEAKIKVERFAGLSKSYVVYYQGK